MAVRDSMEDLIKTVRRMIGDPIGENEHFSDQDIQDVLDRRRMAVRYVPLTLVESVAPGGAVSYGEFHDSTERGNWEADTVLVDSNYTVVTPTTANLISGVWTFSPARTDPSIYIVGAQYDINATAADLLEEWMSATKREVSFSSASRSYQRGEMNRNFMASIAKYRSRSWIVVSEMVDQGVFPSRRRTSNYGF